MGWQAFSDAPSQKVAEAVPNIETIFIRRAIAQSSLDSSSQSGYRKRLFRLEQKILMRRRIDKKKYHIVTRWYARKNRPCPTT
jgi:hypothetical protein